MVPRSRVVVRDLAVVVLMALVVRDVLRPDGDVVRTTWPGVDDPAGGVLDGKDEWSSGSGGPCSRWGRGPRGVTTLDQRGDGSSRRCGPERSASAAQELISSACAGASPGVSRIDGAVGGAGDLEE